MVGRFAIERHMLLKEPSGSRYSDCEFYDMAGAISHHHGCPNTPTRCRCGDHVWRLILSLGQRHAPDDGLARVQAAEIDLHRDGGRTFFCRVLMCVHTITGCHKGPSRQDQSTGQQPRQAHAGGIGASPSTMTSTLPNGGPQSACPPAPW